MNTCTNIDDDHKAHDIVCPACHPNGALGAAENLTRRAQIVLGREGTGQSHSQQRVALGRALATFEDADDNRRVR